MPKAEDDSIAFSIPREWEDDDFLRRFDSRSRPLDAAILAALLLKKPQEQLSRLEQDARFGGRKVEAAFWQRAQDLLVAILTPTDEADEALERPTVH